MKETDFLAELMSQIERARRQGLRDVEVSAFELHRLLGAAPYPRESLPLCCEVMRNAMRAGDQIVSAPPHGAGAWFTVRYQVTQAKSA